MNINPVSFKGTFYINQDSISQRKINKIIDKSSIYNAEINAGTGKNYNKLFFQVSEEFDEKMKKLFAKLRIPYIQINESQAANMDNVISRMVRNDNIKEDGSQNFYVTRNINVKKFDKELQKDKDCYVGINGQNGSAEKYQRFVNYLSTNQEINPPILDIVETKDGKINTYIADGRHRFAVMRDLGFDEIPVNIESKSLSLAQKAGYLI